MTAKEHLAEAEKDATECVQQIRAAFLKLKSADVESVSTRFLILDAMYKQIEVERMIKQLLA